MRMRLKVGMKVRMKVRRKLRRKLRMKLRMRLRMKGVMKVRTRVGMKMRKIHLSDRRGRTSLAWISKTTWPTVYMAKNSG